MITVSRDRIVWDAAEKQRIIDTAVELYQREENKEISLRQLMKAAMIAAMPPERQRDLRGVSGDGMDWFVTGLKRRVNELRRSERKAAERNARAPEPAPGPEPGPEPVKRGPKTPFHQRIRWTEEEKAALVAAAVPIARAEPKLAYASRAKVLLRRAMPVALPEARHRDAGMIRAEDLEWFVSGVEHGLVTPPEPEPVELPPAEPGPEPKSRPRPTVDLSGIDLTGFKVPAPLRAGAVEAPGAIPEAPAAFPAEVLGTGFVTPAPAPVAAPVASRDQVLALLAGMDNTTIIGLLLSRLQVERQTDVTALTAMMGQVQAMKAQLDAMVGQIHDLAGRIVPLEAKAQNSNRLLRTVLASLDPDLLAACDQAPEPANEADPLPVPALAPPAAPPVPMPKPRICILGVKPSEEAKVAKRVNGHANVSCVWDNATAIRLDYKPYDRVVVTPFASHSAVNRVKSQVDPDQITVIPSRNMEQVLRGVVDVAHQFEDDWRREHMA